MGIFEDIIARSRPDYRPNDDAAFPELTPDEPVVRPRNPFDMLKKKGAGPDQLSPAIQLALSSTPGIGAGMLTGVDQSPFLNPTERAMQIAAGGDPGPEVPMPMARPPEPTPLPRPRPVSTDISSSDRPARSPAAPIQIAPQVPQQAAPEQSPFGLPSILDRLRTGLGDNSNTLLAIGAGLAGAPNWGQGISRAAAAAIPARAADLKQSLERSSRGYGVKALIDAGVPVQLAIAAQGDTDLKKALIKNYIEDRQKKIVEVGQDPNTGAVIRAEHDPFSGELKPIDMSKFLPQGNTAAAAGVDGPEYLEQLKQTNPDRARRVEAIINGDSPFPTGRAAQTPLGAALINDAYRVEPGTSEADFKVRQGVRTNYASGDSSRVTKSLNTTVQHGAGLEKAIKDLNNFSFAPEYTNALTGAIKKQYDKSYQDARKRYIANAEPFIKELDFVLSGGKPTVSGRKDLQGMFSIDASTNENMSSLHKAMDLLNGRLQSHAEGYNKGMRTKREGIDFIDPVNRGHFKRLLSGGEEKAPEAAGTTVFKPGGSYKLLPDGTLVPK